MSRSAATVLAVNAAIPAPLASHSSVAGGGPNVWWTAVRLAIVSTPAVQRSDTTPTRQTTLSRVATKDPVCNGNTENWRALVSEESIIAWHFRSFARKRATMRAWAARPDGAPVMLLRHPRELDRLLSALT